MSEIKRFVTSDLKKINETEDASPMTLEFNRNKKIFSNDCRHFALYPRNIFLKNCSRVSLLLEQNIKVTVNHLRNMRSCETHFCSSGIAEEEHRLAAFVFKSASFLTSISTQGEEEEEEEGGV